MKKEKLNKLIHKFKINFGKNKITKNYTYNIVKYNYPLYCFFKILMRFYTFHGITGF